jgi:ADP-heptose:LPS heptosyltransferase
MPAIQVLRGRDYDVALDLQGLLKSAAMARLSGARRVIGFETAALRERGAAWFYSEASTVPSGAHVIQKNLSVLARLGVAATPVRFPFVVPDSAVARQVVADAASRGPGPFVLINPGAGWPNKRWVPSRFGAVAAAIRDERAWPTFVLWGRDESSLADAVVEHSRGAAIRAPETNLGDLLALTSRAALMISGDTGPTHIAAAMGTPIVGLYGPTWPERNGPWDPNDIVVSRAPQCVCHHKRQCLRDGGPERMCINDISVDELMQAIRMRLSRTGGPPA